MILRSRSGLTSESSRRSPTPGVDRDEMLAQRSGRFFWNQATRAAEVGKVVEDVGFDRLDREQRNQSDCGPDPKWGALSIDLHDVVDETVIVIPQ
jgi:hypothetical protein